MISKSLCYFSQKFNIHESQLMVIMLKILLQKTHSLHQAVDPRQWFLVDKNFISQLLRLLDGLKK